MSAHIARFYGRDKPFKLIHSHSVTADRLYTSSLKILASLKARGDQGERTSHIADYFDSSETTSRLLVPVSPTPLLDYLETALEGRARYLSRVLSAYRSLVSRGSRNGTHVATDQTDEDFMTKLLKAKYLRTGSKSPAIKDKKRAAVNMAIERLEKALKLGKSEAALVLADLFLVSDQKAHVRKEQPLIASLFSGAAMIFHKILSKLPNTIKA